MAFTPTNSLVSDPVTHLRDQQHAAKLFGVDQFRLAPKSKFSFHVAFGINRAALKSIDLVQRYGAEINMLVKSVDLPSFTMSTETLNQYNRKKLVQTTHKFGESTIKFHDDNMGLINSLWQNYYSYYYADSTSALTNGAYGRNATRSSKFINSAYGLDNRSTEPFFSYIKLYQMARHEYVCYTLHNPMITSWNHNKVDYGQNALHDFDMKLGYEAVSYSIGNVDEDSPEGFGMSHYDTVDSPLTGLTTVGGPSLVSASSIGGSAESILDTVITQINTAQNTKQPGAPAGSGILGSVPQTLNGLQGFAFPLSGLLK